MVSDANVAVKKSPAQWKKMTSPYCGADTIRSVVQLTLTLLVFFGLWVAMFWSLHVGYWLTLLLGVPAGGFLVRLFIIQHDCGHGSYFRSKVVRDSVGFVLGVLTLCPYQYWRQTHAYHHSHSGDLDFRGFGDIETKTVEEYLSLSKRNRILYRLYRNPFIMLGFGPVFQFLIKHRYPWDVPRSWKAAWRSVWLTNIVLVALVIVMGSTIGYTRFLMIQSPITLTACAIGVWLFYVQHQYEDTYWHRHKNWNYFDAALMGSSHLVLPRPLQWLTAYIGIHHIHHMDSQIPNYRLEECLAANPELQGARRITMMDSWHLLRLTLWDEEQEQLISFRQLGKRQKAVHA